jgi:hypothetical protein
MSIGVAPPFHELIFIQIAVFGTVWWRDEKGHTVGVREDADGDVRMAGLAQRQ